MADTDEIQEEKGTNFLSILIAPFLLVLGILGKWGRRFLSLLLILLVLAFAAALSGTERRAERTGMTEAELNTEEREALPQDTEMELYRNLIQVVQAMQYSDLTLQGREAVKIGGAFISDGEKISIKELNFFYHTNEVHIHYEYEAGNDVFLEMTPRYFRKTFTRYEGVSVKFKPWEFYKTIRWYVWGQFWKGYAQYTYETDMQNGYAVGSPAITKQVFRTVPFEKVARFFRLFGRAVSLVMAE